MGLFKASSRYRTALNFVTYKALRAPRQRLEDFVHSRLMKVARLSALRTGSLYASPPPPPREDSWKLFQLEAESNPGAVPSDRIGDRIRDLPACSAVPQRTAPPRSPFKARW